jgi:hypothetical protein
VLSIEGDVKRLHKWSAEDRLATDALAVAAVHEDVHEAGPMTALLSRDEPHVLLRGELQREVGAIAVLEPKRHDRKVLAGIVPFLTLKETVRAGEARRVAVSLRGGGRHRRDR